MTKREVGIAILLATLTWFVVGFRADRLGLDHFDEGIYALGALAVATDRFPADLDRHQHLISPPLYFVLAGALMRIGDAPDDRPLFFLNRLFATLLVVLVFLVGRSWHGSTAGAVAALLVFANDYFIVNARSAMTDVMFTFWFLAALWVGERAAARDSRRLAFLAGLLTGLAWNTKYHGWLVVAIFGLAESMKILRTRRLDVRSLSRLSIMGVTAALVYLPWAIHIGSLDDGFRSLAANHRRFLTGVGVKWFANAWMQLKNQWSFDGWFSRSSLIVVSSIFLIRHHRSIGRIGIVLTGLAVIAVSLGIGTVPALLAAVGLFMPFAFKARSPLVPMHACSAAVFLVLAPFYLPYARLLLPLVVLSAIAVAALLRSAADRGRVPLLGRSGARWILASICVLGGVVGVIRGDTLSTPRTFEGTSQASRVADGLIDELPARTPVAVIGEPALTFYLRTRSVEASSMHSMQEWKDTFADGRRRALVLGPYGRRTGNWTQWIQEHKADVSSRGSATGFTKPLRALDDEPPWQLGSRPSSKIRTDWFLVR